MLKEPRSGTAAGSDHQVQFNNNGAFGGASALTYNDGTNVTSASSIVNSTRVELDGRKIESSTISSTVLSGAFNVDLGSGHIYRNTGNPSADYTPNLRMNSSTTFNSDTAVGDVLTVTLIIKANGYKISGVQIDGSTLKHRFGLGWRNCPSCFRYKWI